jgi:hypothetical protein
MRYFFSSRKRRRTQNFWPSLSSRSLLKRKNSNRGFSMLVVLLIGISLVGLLTAYIVFSRMQGISAGSSVDSTSGFYAAETGLNMRFDNIFDRFNNRGRPTGTSPASVDACTDNTTGNDGSDDLRCITYNVPSSGINPTSASNSPQRVAATYVVDNTEYGANGQPVPKSIPAGEAFAGLATQEYSYQLNSVARKLATTPQTEAVLSMDIKSRVIPIFQFAAFFDGDLETTNTAPMTLNGRVHSNGNIYFGAGSSSPYLTVTGQVTTPNNIYASSKFTTGASASDLQTPVGRVNIANNSGTNVELVANGTAAGTPTRDPMDWTLMGTKWGGSIAKTSPLQMPDPGLLTTSGDYFNKADLRITYRPQATVPFRVARVDSTSTATTRPGTDLDIDLLKSLQQPVMTPPNTVTGSLRSGLTFSGADLRRGICPPMPPPRDGLTPISDFSITNSGYTTLSAQVPVANRAALAEALYTTILRQSNPVNFSDLYRFVRDPANATLLGNVSSPDANSFYSVLPRRDSFFNDLATNTTKRDAIRNATPAQIAALAGRTFCSAPLQTLQFYNYRESGNVNILQANIEALTVWNKDGRTVDWNSTGTTVIGDNSAQGFALSPSTPLFATQTSGDSGAPNYSFQKLGYAASDTTEAGMVVHMTVDCRDDAGTSIAACNTNATSNSSKYGFALVRGAQLMGLAKTATTTDPTGVTFVTDQAIYTQGDFNTSSSGTASGGPATNSIITGISNKQPAAILADSFNLLSNACMSKNDRIAKTSNSVNCDDGTDRFSFNGTSNITRPFGASYLTDGTDTVTPTEVNAGILSGVDVTTTSSFNGGLHNYPRFHENWGDGNFGGSALRVLRYSGSWVNLKTCDPNDATCPATTAATPNPKRVSGSFVNPSLTSYNPPRREWGFDTSFNAVENLPPLDPRFVYLKQETFVRSFDR